MGKLFGVRFLWIESFVFDTASSLSPDYSGGNWQFHSLSNGGFYMVPDGQADYKVECDNGFEGRLSAEAFGIVSCLYAYSLLSFSADGDFAGVCANHYHLLREFALGHPEAQKILAAID